MKLRYQKDKGNRIKHRFDGMFCTSGKYWYEHNSKSWKKLDEITPPHSNYKKVKTVKAFIKELKNAPKGIDFTLSSIWGGFDVYGKGSK